MNKERDYSKPVILHLTGKKGWMQYKKIVTSPKIKYNAKAASERAAKNLKSQGVVL